MIEMYLAGVSVRRVKVSLGTFSNLDKKIYARIEKWRNRPIKCEHPYVYFDGIVLKRT